LIMENRLSPDPHGLAAPLSPGYAPVRFQFRHRDPPSFCPGEPPGPGPASPRTLIHICISVLGALVFCTRPFLAGSRPRRSPYPRGIIRPRPTLSAHPWSWRVKDHRFHASPNYHGLAVPHTGATLGPRPG